MFTRIITRVIEWMLILMLATMVILVFGNVVLRYGFNSGWVFSEEVSRFLFMWLTLLGALLAMHSRAHLGSNSIVKIMPRPVQRVMRFVSGVIVLACCLLIAWGTWTQVQLAMSDLAPITGIPMGIVFTALLVSSIGMALIQLHDLYRQLRGDTGTGPDPSDPHDLPEQEASTVRRRP